MKRFRCWEFVFWFWGSGFRDYGLGVGGSEVGRGSEVCRGSEVGKGSEVGYRGLDNLRTEHRSSRVRIKISGFKPRGSRLRIRVCHVGFVAYRGLKSQGGLALRTSARKSSECGTHKTVTARFWPWLSGNSPKKRCKTLPYHLGTEGEVPHVRATSPQSGSSRVWTPAY